MSILNTCSGGGGGYIPLLNYFPIGPQGSTGPTGPQGLMGPTGVTGPTGQPATANSVSCGEMTAQGLGLNNIIFMSPRVINPFSSAPITNGVGTSLASGNMTIFSSGIYLINCTISGFGTQPGTASFYILQLFKNNVATNGFVQIPTSTNSLPFETSFAFTDIALAGDTYNVRIATTPDSSTGNFQINNCIFSINAVGGSQGFTGPTGSIGFTGPIGATGPVGAVLGQSLYGELKTSTITTTKIFSALNVFQGFFNLVTGIFNGVTVQPNPSPTPSRFIIQETGIYNVESDLSFGVTAGAGDKTFQYTPFLNGVQAGVGQVFEIGGAIQSVSITLTFLASLTAGDIVDLRIAQTIGALATISISRCNQILILTSPVQGPIGPTGPVGPTGSNVDPRIQSGVNFGDALVWRPALNRYIPTNTNFYRI